MEAAISSSARRARGRCWGPAQHHGQHLPRPPRNFQFQSLRSFSGLTSEKAQLGSEQHGWAVGGVHVDPTLTPFGTATIRPGSTKTWSSGFVCPGPLGVPPHPKPLEPSELQNSFHVGAVHSSPRLSGEVWKGREGGGCSCLAADLRDRVRWKGGWPPPGSSPPDGARAPALVAGDQLPFSRTPDNVCSVSLDMRRRLSTRTATTDPPPCAHTPHPQAGVPLPGQSTAPSVGRSSERPFHPQTPLSLRSQADARSPFHISTPRPSTAISSRQFSPSRQPPSCSRVDSFACSSGKERAKSLSSNDVICSTHHSWLPASLPRPHPSPVLTVYPLFNYD